MNRSLRFFSLALGILTVLTASAQVSILGNGGAEMTQAVSGVLPGECLVIFVDQAGQEVYLDITRDKGAMVGRKFTLERIGGEIRHPVTGDVVGRQRNRIAEAQITWIQDGFCKAKVLSVTAGNEIRVKDSARPSEPPTIIRFPLRHADGTISKLTEAADAEIATALSAVQGGTVKVGPTLALAPDAATSLTSLAPEGDVAVAGRITDDAIEISVISMARNAVVKTLRLPLTDEWRRLGTEKLRSAPPASMSGSFERIGYKEGGEISAALDFVPNDMTTGDIDGDGSDEFIFVEERAVRIVKLKLDGSLEQVARVSLGWSARGYMITAGDVDRDGKAEIFVTEKPGNYVRSDGYRFANGKLTRFFHEANMFVRVIQTSEGPVLYGQRNGTNRPFDRGIVRYRYANGAMQSASGGIPTALTLFEFTPIGTTGFLAGINYEQKLRLYNNSGSVQWTSAESYGGSDIEVTSGDRREHQELRNGVTSVDIDGDGNEELLVVQNLLEGGLTGSFVRIGVLQQYRSGRIVALSLENNSLVERWKTRTFNGIIKGFSVAQPLARGREVVFFSVEKVGFTGKKATLQVVPLN